MPVMNGVEATRRIRSLPSEAASLPIIAMTAHALVEEKQRCLDAGMNDHVTKPIDPDALFATLRRWAKPRKEAVVPKKAVLRRRAIGFRRSRAWMSRMD